MASPLLLALLLTAAPPPSGLPPEESAVTRLLISPLAGVGFGSVAAMGGALALGLLSVPYCHLSSGHPEAPACGRMLVTGGAMGFGLGAALGVTLSGERLGGRRRKDITFAVGTLLPFLGSLTYHLLSPVEGSNPGLDVGAGVALVVGMPLAASLAYELSPPAPPSQGGPRLPVVVVPLALPLPGGGLAGVAGSF